VWITRNVIATCPSSACCGPRPIILTPSRQAVKNEAQRNLLCAFAFLRDGKIIPEFLSSKLEFTHVRDDPLLFLLQRPDRLRAGHGRSRARQHHRGLAAKTFRALSETGCHGKIHARGGGRGLSTEDLRAETRR